MKPNSKVPDIGPTKSASPDHKKWLEGISSPLKPNFKVKFEGFKKIKKNSNTWITMDDRVPAPPKINLPTGGSKVLDIMNEEEKIIYGFAVWLSNNFKLDNLELKGRWTMVNFRQYVLPYLTAGSRRKK
jgi:hypothetical protein